ncbi:lipoyl(octanoyl) transferase LipB [Mastigocoleus sp. MO_188.B34]|uniref:lipoyl(octanoyl) transferase LipB n=1 Tax=Mastigocoleus sp. MO_188.B34 TaxID=3036635 RepID=UPI002637A3A0|nr:lipoyl(octanoyl) transferase LipB [Mastigocoleus sp. MO_188.B34]MDJ0695874.1 lipoyl(octanoyl) transferase LipB [Mastigocoleus sp. MO_188.B34]
MTHSRNQCFLYNQGVLLYGDAHKWQKELVAARIQDPSLDDVLILLEHPPVYTLGQGGSLDFLKFDPGKIQDNTQPVSQEDLQYNSQHNSHSIYRVERGGEVTYHCLGQLVGYPILNLQRHRKDLHWYLRQLEEVLIRVLSTYGLPAERVPSLTGVWVDGYKVAAIGIKVSRWITMHGFALNVCPDLSGFKQIVPCGISDKPIGSLVQWIPDITVSQVRPLIANMFAQVFDLEIIEIEAKDKS